MSATIEITDADVADLKVGDVATFRHREDGYEFTGAIYAGYGEHRVAGWGVSNRNLQLVSATRELKLPTEPGSVIEARVTSWQEAGAQILFRLHAERAAAGKNVWQNIGGGRFSEHRLELVRIIHDAGAEV